MPDIQGKKSKVPKRVLISNEFLDLHRGEKDFVLGKSLAATGRFEVEFLHSGNVSIPDEDAGFRRNDPELGKRLAGSAARARTYAALRLVRRTHNKRVAYLLPQPFSYLLALLRFRPRWIVDTVYTTLTPRSMLNGLYCRISGAGMIILDAGDEAKNRRLLPLERSVVRWSKAVFTYNLASERRIRSKYGLPDDHRFVIHHKMLDDEDFRLDPERIREGAQVGYVGRFVEAKGFGKFLDFAVSNGSIASFSVVGHNDEGFRIPESVHASPAVRNKDLHEVYSTLDFLAIPDLSRFRSYATVVQEALCCGCRVWVGRLPPEYFPVPDLVDFYDPDSPQGLVSEIERYGRMDLESKRRLRISLSEKARARLASGLVVDRISSLMEGRTDP